MVSVYEQSAASSLDTRAPVLRNLLLNLLLYLPLYLPLGSQKRLSLSTIESSVTKLLVSTKHLLESLTQWSRCQVNEKFVSDAYVKLGNDFRSATKVFTAAGVETADIGDVPQALRVILESALSEPPSQENLDRFLPNIRNIIVTLLLNLKSKQAEAKASAQRRIPKPYILSPVAASPSRENMSVPVQRTSMNSENSLALPKEAIAQLQQGDLPRSASKRYSAYQISKLTQGTHANQNTASQHPSHEPEPLPVPKLGRLSIDIQQGDVNVSVPASRPHRLSRSLATLATIGASLIAPEKPVTSQAQSRQTAQTPPRNMSQAPGTVALFLQLHGKTRRVVVLLPVTLTALRLLFVEKFAYSPGTESFPEIYLRDKDTDISYELEEAHLENVQDGSLLLLNEPHDDVVALKSLESKISELTLKFNTITKDITETITSSIKAIEPATNLPPVSVPPSKPTEFNKGILSRDVAALQNEIRGLQLQQKLNNKAYKALIEEIMLQVKSFQEDAIQISPDTNRRYIETCHATLSGNSDLLLTSVDELQDIMESLSLDVAVRGVRVGDKQLKATLQNISKAKSSLADIMDYIVREKPMWKKIWENELDKVCEEQQFFNLQEDLTRDLEDDLVKITERFELLKQCSQEQAKHSAHKRNKIVARLPIPAPGESLHNLKDAVLNEVIALKPDHEGRVEAIAKAELARQRQRELDMISEFQEELGEFVGVGKLKSFGGIDEVERNRQIQDAENLKASLGMV